MRPKILIMPALIALIAVIFLGCDKHPEGNTASKFYVGECSGGYCVYLYARDNDTIVTNKMPIAQAQALVDKLNTDVGENFAGTYNRAK